MYDNSEWLPLTPAQLDFWEEFSLHPGCPVSTVAHAVTLTGPVDEAALAAAIRQMVAECEILSVRFRLPPGASQPVQKIEPEFRPELRLFDLRDHADPDKVAYALMQQDYSSTVELCDTPICAQWLLRCAQDRWIWYSRGHHIILDGYSMSLIERRVATLYAAHLAGQRDAALPLGHFADYLAEEEAYCRSNRFQTDRDYWHARLDGPVPLAVLRKGGEDYGSEPVSETVELKATTGERLKQAAEREGLCWPDLLVLLNVAYLLERFPHPGRALPVWMPCMGRMGSVCARIPALVVNILPLVATAQPGETLQEMITRLRSDLAQMRLHGRYRVERIAADHGLAAGSRFHFSPLINVLPFPAPQFPGCEVSREVLAAGPGDGLNLTYSADMQAWDLRLCLEAEPSFAAGDTLAAHARDLPRFLDAALGPDGLARRAPDLLARM